MNESGTFLREATVFLPMRVPVFRRTENKGWPEFSPLMNRPGPCADMRAPPPGRGRRRQGIGMSFTYFGWS